MPQSMGESSCGKACKESRITMKGSAPAMRDVNVHNRIKRGSSPLSPKVNGGVGLLEKAKSAKHPFLPSSSNHKKTGSSSKISLASSQPKQGSPEDGSAGDAPKVGGGESNLEMAERGGLQSKAVETGSCIFSPGKLGTSRLNLKSGLTNKDAIDKQPVWSRCSWPSKSTSQRMSPNVSRFGSTSDVIPSSSSSASNLPRGNGMPRKVVFERKCSRPSMERKNPASGLSITMADSLQQRRRLSSRDSAGTPARSAGSPRSCNRARIPRLECETTISRNETTIEMEQFPSPIISITTDRSQSTDRTPNLRGVRRLAFAQSNNFQSLWDHWSSQHISFDVLFEYILALERDDLEEEQAIEHLLLDANLFLSELNAYDQHRDMRLDIDNMSYEELLALEEKMGTVSTALTEEAMSECLETFAYQPSPPVDCCIEDANCTICQEGYAEGNEIGKLCCGHEYHLNCIREWLRMKNWCPVCKTSVASSFSSST